MSSGGSGGGGGWDPNQPLPGGEPLQSPNFNNGNWQTSGPGGGAQFPLLPQLFAPAAFKAIGSQQQHQASQDLANRQNQLNAYYKQRFPGYDFSNRTVPFGKPANFFTSGAYRSDPANYNNYYNNPNAFNSENRAFNFPDYEKQRGFFRSQADQWRNKTYEDMNPYVGEEDALIKQLSAASRGEGPSVAQEQLRAATDRNLNSMLASFGSTRAGLNSGLAQRQFMGQTAGANQQAASDSAILRANEISSARQALSGSLAQASDTRLAFQDMQNRMTQYYLNTGLDIDRAQIASRQALESLLRNQYQAANLQQNQLTAAASEGAANRRQANYSAGIGAGGAILGGLAGGLLSDRTKKKDIKRSDKEIREFLSSLTAYAYKYKKPDHPLAGHGKQIGIMAQDLEKTDIGKQMVIDTPSGKVVNMGKGLAAMLAAQASLNERLSAIEEGA